MTFGHRLRAARLAKGLRLSDVADASGISQTYVGEVEREIRDPSLYIMEKLAQAVHADVCELLGGAAPLTEQGEEVARLFAEASAGIQRGVLGVLRVTAHSTPMHTPSKHTPPSH